MMILSITTARTRFSTEKADQFRLFGAN